MGSREILYLFSSAARRITAARSAGINGNTPWYNLARRNHHAGGAIPVYHSAAGRGGQSGGEETNPVTSGTLPTHGALFVGLLVGTVVIVSALTFFPALSLSPIVEHFLMHEGRLF